MHFLCCVFASEPENERLERYRSHNSLPGALLLNMPRWKISAITLPSFSLFFCLTLKSKLLNNFEQHKVPAFKEWFRVRWDSKYFRLDKSHKVSVPYFSFFSLNNSLKMSKLFLASGPNKKLPEGYSLRDARWESPIHLFPCVKNVESLVLLPKVLQQFPCSLRIQSKVLNMGYGIFWPCWPF